MKQRRIERGRECKKGNEREREREREMVEKATLGECMMKLE